MDRIELSEFLDAFPIPLHHRQPESYSKPWIFWSQHECNSSSADLGAPMIHEKIIDALSKFSYYHVSFVQFWAPATIDGRRVLSTSGQPFKVSHLCKEYVKYRLYSSEYKYNIDANKLDIEGDQMIISGGPATAFLTRLSYINPLERIPSEDYDTKLNLSIMIPVCFPSQSQSNCIGVSEITLHFCRNDFGTLVYEHVAGLKEAGMNVCSAQELIRYKAINGLEHVKGEIEGALEVVCGSHNIDLAQVWIAYEDKNNVLFPSSLVDTQTKPLLALKLTGYLYPVIEGDYKNMYYKIFDVFPLGTLHVRKIALKTLQDYESRYNSIDRDDGLGYHDVEVFEVNAFTICLRSNDTGHFDYAFEFIWSKHSDANILLEAILLTLKRRLRSFKFASGAELGDEIHVIDVKPPSNYDNNDKEADEIEIFKLFKGKGSSPLSKALEDGKKRMVADYIEPSEVKCKTTEIVLSREDIKRQFGKTMKRAAKNLNVSESTLKRKLKKLGIREWQGPNFGKRKANDSSVIQINTYGEDNGAIQEPPNVNINENTVTIKAEYEGDLIKFRLPFLQATFATVEKEIVTRFKLSLGTYKLKYCDEDGDWILLSSHEEITDCIKSCRKFNSNKVQLRVLPSIQPISGQGRPGHLQGSHEFNSQE